MSAASIWEIAIEYALGKSARLDFPVPKQYGSSGQAGFEILSITGMHASAVEILPPLHRDPFDRLLVAQARTERLQLVTHDLQVAAYGGEILLA